MRIKKEPEDDRPISWSPTGQDMEANKICGQNDDESHFITLFYS